MLTLWLGLIGAVIGATASVAAQIVNQNAIRRREDRDKLRAAYIEFAEAAFRLVQRAELVLIYTHNQVQPLEPHGVLKEVKAEQYKLTLEAGAALDQLTTALCRLAMLRPQKSALDDGEALYRGLMAQPTEACAQGTNLDDLMKLADAKRSEILAWLRAQTVK